MTSPDGCRPEVLAELRRRASQPYQRRSKGKPGPITKHLRARMIDAIVDGHDPDVIPISVHPCFRLR